MLGTGMLMVVDRVAQTFDGATVTNGVIAAFGKWNDTVATGLQSLGFAKLHDDKPDQIERTQEIMKVFASNASAERRTRSAIRRFLTST